MERPNREILNQAVTTGAWQLSYRAHPPAQRVSSSAPTLPFNLDRNQKMSGFPRRLFARVSGMGLSSKSQLATKPAPGWPALSSARMLSAGVAATVMTVPTTTAWRLRFQQIPSYIGFEAPQSVRIVRHRRKLS